MKRILLLEDDAAVAASVRGAIAIRGHDVVWADSVAAAKTAYVPDYYDVIVCDYALPDGTGLDFLASVRAVDKATTILWSGLDRSSELAASGLRVDYLLAKDQIDKVLAAVEGAA